ncbi:MAG: hypothetical protein GY936_02665 [Ignavibacteriae bacterium]|nr:hypothetical protein [Ignavibacteriota bacterium]
MKLKYCEIANDLCPGGIEGFNEDNRIFTSYSSHNKEIEEIVENGLKILNKETDKKWVRWKDDMEIENNMIYCEICENICRSKAVIIELSDLNFNVVFEYGYSLGLGKKIYPTVNSEFDFNDIDRFLKPLLGIGIGRYDKNKFSQKILKKKFWEKGKTNYLFGFDNSDILDNKTNIKANSVLYLKNIDRLVVTEEIENQLLQSSFNLIIDDPKEDINNMVWYNKQIKKSIAVVIDLGMSNKEENLNHYLKCALIAGLSVATGRRVLLLSSVHAPKPSDIISIIKQYNSAKSAKQFVEKFIKQHSNFLSVINSYIHALDEEKKSPFDMIDLGEHVAENDTYHLRKNFVETPEYLELSKPGYKLIIGRKGTGKSAAFQKFKMEERDDTIVVSKFFNQYNLDDIYDLTKSFEKDNDKNKVVIAFWKYVLFSIITKELYKYLTNKNETYLNKSEREYFVECQKFAFVSNDKSITENLVEIVNSIRSKDESSVKFLQKQFYSNEVVVLSKLTTTYLVKNHIKLFVNVDGLDSNLNVESNSKLISLILYNLNEVCTTIFPNDYSDYSINLFLREDIYDIFKEKITQKDKLRKIIYKWDMETLLRMINKRLKSNGIDNITELLADEFNMKILTDKLDKFIYSRPRDYIFVFNNLIQFSKIYKLDKINSRAFNEMLDYYASHIFESIEAELLSLDVEINYGEFLNGIKRVSNNNAKIPIDYFEGLLDTLSITDNKREIFLTFLLKIEFMYLLENNHLVVWSKLIDPQTKLKYFFEHSNDRKQFQFHPIIHFLLEKHF